MFELLVLMAGFLGPHADDAMEENDLPDTDHTDDGAGQDNIIPLHQFMQNNGMDIPHHEDASYTENGDAHDTQEPHHDDGYEHEGHDHHDEEDVELIDLPVEDIPELGLSIILEEAAIHTIHHEDIDVPDPISFPDVTLPEQANSPVFDRDPEDETTRIDETSHARPDHAGGGKDPADEDNNKGGKGHGKPDRGDGSTDDSGDDTTTDEGGEDTTDETDPVAPEAPEVLTRYVSGTENGYNVAINFSGEWTAELQSAFIESAEHISQTILEDVPDVSGFYEADDIEIDASLVDIDGENGVLGRAGPTVIRTDTGLPVEGIMEFDAADAQAYADAGLWTDIVFHEMLHTLGVGPLWDYVGLTEGSVANDDLRFTGDMATESYHSEFADIAGNDALSQNGVPIETHGGSGTAGGHWDEALFGNEIMTGYINGSNYLSEMTVASIEDLGYDTYLDDPDTQTDATGSAPQRILSGSMIA